MEGKMKDYEGKMEKYVPLYTGRRIRNMKEK